MQYHVEGSTGVITGFTRAELQKLKSLPVNYKIVGTRFKFPANDALFQSIRALGVSGVPQDAPLEQIETVKATFQNVLEPFAHQHELFEATKNLELYAFLWEMGLGKTKIALDTAAHLYHEGEIDALLVLTLNGVHVNWVNKEIPEHLHRNTNYVAEYWSSQRGAKPFQKIMRHPGLLIAAVNVEALSTQKGVNFCLSFLHQRKALMVVDESHAFKNPAARRTKALLKLAPLTKYRRIMSGTVGDRPTHLYAQYRFLKDNIFYPIQNYHAFRARFTILRDLPSNPRVKLEVGYQNLDELRAIIDPISSRLTKADCLDLPEKIYVRRPFEMTAEQTALYKALVKRAIAEIDGANVTAAIAITRMLRLHQIACGFITVDENEQNVGFDSLERTQAIGDSNPRIENLLEGLEMVPGKAIIWATYRYSLREIVEAIKKEYGDGSVVGYSGMTPPDKRELAVKQFQDENSPVRFFVGQPRAGGTGITLTQASHVFYYSNDYSLTVRLQSEDRAHRIGQTKSVTYHDLQANGTIDKQIISSLIEKRDVASKLTGDELVDWLKQQ